MISARRPGVSSAGEAVSTEAGQDRRDPHVLGRPGVVAEALVEVAWGDW